MSPQDRSLFVKNPKKSIMIAQCLFWMSFFIFSFLYEQQFNSANHAFLYSSKDTLFYAILIYIHAFYILPILNIRQYSSYTIVSLLFLSIVIFIRLYFEYAFFYDPLSKSQFSEYYHFSTNQIAKTIASGIVALIVSTLIKFTFDYFLLQNRQNELTNSRLKVEMKYLKSQINPHFLFNTLNSLLYLTKNKSNLAPDVVEKLSSLMRYMLEHKDSDVDLLSHELEFIKVYLDLERIRIPHIEIQLEIPNLTEEMKVPSMIFLPLVENAFKHGIDKEKKDNLVHIDLKIADKYLTFIVENKIQNPKSKNRKHGELGIDNLKKRLSLLFEQDYQLNFYEIDTIFKAELIIPIK